MTTVNYSYLLLFDCTAPVAPCPVLWGFCPSSGEQETEEGQTYLFFTLPLCMSDLHHNILHWISHTPYTPAHTVIYDTNSLLPDSRHNADNTAFATLVDYSINHALLLMLTKLRLRKSIVKNKHLALSIKYSVPPRG